MLEAPNDERVKLRFPKWVEPAARLLSLVEEPYHFPVDATAGDLRRTERRCVRARAHARVFVCRTRALIQAHSYDDA